MREQGFWKRGVLGLPIATLLMMSVIVLIGRDRNVWGAFVQALLLGFVAWPITFWLLDRIFGRYHPPS